MYLGLNDLAFSLSLPIGLLVAELAPLLFNDNLDIWPVSSDIVGLVGLEMARVGTLFWPMLAFYKYLVRFISITIS
jgi:hypothetical protein